MPRLFPLFAIAALFAPALRAGYSREKYTAPAPGDVRLEIETTKTMYFIGEPFRAKVVLRNTGRTPFRFEFGGDYRGLNRSERFIVGLFDEHGVAAPAIPASGFAGGGRFGPNTVEPGKTWTIELWPLDYRKIPGPGRYTLRITHDFGWNGDRRATDPKFDRDAVFSDKDWKSPVGETTVTFVVPDEKQIEAILDRIESAIRKNDRAGIPEPKDFALPIYFPSLKRRLGSGGPQLFLDAIATMPSREATAELIMIASREDHPLAVEAADRLFRRLPDLPPQWARAHIVAEWDDAMKLMAAGIGRRLLAAYAVPGLSLAEADRRVIAGARLATTLPEEADYAPLCAALEKLTDRCASPRRHPVSGDENPERPLYELFQAFDAFHKKYARSYDNAAPLLRFRYPVVDTEARRRRLIEQAMLFGDTPNWLVRIAAIRALPKPLPAQCRKFVADSLESRDFGVVAAACQAIGDSGDPSWIPDLLLVIRAENDEWAVRSAFEAAQKLGARRNLAEALADRLIDTDLSQVALELLVRMSVKNTDSTGGDWRTHKAHAALQSAWKKWIREHAADLDAGVRFAPGDDKNLPAALFGLVVKWDIPGRGRWP